MCFPRPNSLNAMPSDCCPPILAEFMFSLQVLIPVEQDSVLICQCSTLYGSRPHATFNFCTFGSCSWAVFVFVRQFWFAHMRMHSRALINTQTHSIIQHSVQSISVKRVHCDTFTVKWQRFFVWKRISDQKFYFFSTKWMEINCPSEIPVKKPSDFHWSFNCGVSCDKLNNTVMRCTELSISSFAKSKRFWFNLKNLS